MKIYLKELKKYIDLSKTKIEDIVESLNFIGLEVEAKNIIVPQLNLKVGEILSIEKHPNADSLNVAQVKVEHSTHQIICGAPNVVDAKFVVVVLPGSTIMGTKIKSKKIRDIESSGMICSLKEIGIPKEVLSKEDEDGIIILQNPTEIDALKEMCLDDYVIEVDILKNRYDSLSYLEIAKSLATRLEVNVINIHSKNNSTLDLSLEVNLDKNVTDYSLIKIEEAKIAESPWEIKSVLYAAGIKPVNNFVDLGEYIRLIHKQPIFLYDAKNIKNIYIKKTLVNEALDSGQKVTSKEKILCITNHKKEIVSIAGIATTEKFKVNKKTKSIIIEASLFAKETIQEAEELLNIQTNSSTLFKKDMTNENISFALSHYVEKVLKYGWSKEITKEEKINSTPTVDSIINLNIQNVNRYLGFELEEKEIINLLYKSSIRFLKSNSKTMEFAIPKYKVFINSEPSLIEELLRNYGVDKIESLLPFEYIGVNHINEEECVKSKIKNLMVNLGFNEVLTYSLVSEETNDKTNIFNYKNILKLLPTYQIKNNEMRVSIFNDLILVSDQNKRYKKDINNIFEISEIYHDLSKKTHIAGLIKKDFLKDVSSEQVVENNIFAAKFFIQKIINIINPNIKLEFNSNKTKPTTLLQREILIKIKSKTIGFIGNNLLNNEVVFELKIEPLINYEKVITKIISPPKTTINKMDISLISNNFKKINKFISLLKEQTYVIDVSLESVYEMESVLISVKYQDFIKTMDNKSIEKFTNHINELVKKNGLKLK